MMLRQILKEEHEAFPVEREETNSVLQTEREVAAVEQGRLMAEAFEINCSFPLFSSKMKASRESPEEPREDAESGRDPSSLN